VTWSHTEPAPPGGDSEEGSAPDPSNLGGPIVARNSLWHLVRSDAQARRRLVVGSAFAVFLGGLLTAAGLASVVLVACLLIVALVGGTAAVRALRRNRHHVGSWISGLRARALRAVRRARHSIVAQVAHLASSLRARRVDAHHEALRLNVAGAQQRRSGAHAEAIQLHTRALEILHDTEDLGAVALTQNNLALAMSHAGDDPAATSLFEQAAATARELGDREQEGKIMANLALAHRRQGRSRECEEVLRLALTKLRRDSTAYRRVEAELSRVA
jgi:tetratricopeptide (TPR) repeat protein